MEQPRPSRVEKSRPAKACNTCRRKKVKCDGKRPVCSSCIIFKLPCGFEDTGKHSGRPSRAYVEELEERVKRMDEQLQLLSRGGKLSEQSIEDSQPSGLAADMTRTSGVSNSELLTEGNISATTWSPDDEASLPDQEISDQPSYVLRAQDGKMRFFGASSGFSLHYSQEANQPGAKHPKLTLGNAVRRSAVQWPLTNWVPRILQDSFEQRTTQPLPSKEATMTLVTEFLTTLNRTIPLVDDTTLIRLAERQFSWNPDESPSSWILINVAIAFSYRERAQASTEASDDWKKSLGHIKNALNVLVDIFLRNADLPAVQGLLGLALYFQGTPNAQALFMLAASGLRLSHSIGLHRNTTSGFTPSEVEERRRTFWVAFILDADISIRVGRPPIQDGEDYNTPLPADSPHDGRGIICIDGGSINHLRVLSQFALVQRRIYQHLQTVAVIRQPKEAALKFAKAYEETLLEWKSSIPDIFRPQHIFTSEPHYSHQHLLRLQLAYHSCYANLHQLLLFISSGNPRSQESDLEVDKEITALCLRSIDSARSALALLPYARLLRSSYRWNVLYFFATASAALASRLRIHPTHQHSKDDLVMVHETNEFLTKVSNEEPGTFVDFIRSVCSDLENSARRAIHQAQSDNIRRPETGVDNNAVDLENDFSGQLQYADGTDNSLFNNEVDLLTDANPDLLNPLWSISPFWNWRQEMFVSMPLTSTPEITKRRTDDPT